jgi:2-desacetyl-2-hydroxyethyl bacteriochlorophyllide A dehydrogenase
MRELWFVAPRKVEIREAELPAPGDGEIVVRGLASCVSQGTELLLYRGEGPPRFDPSLDGAEGNATYPRRYGYAWVGETESRARFFALAPHADAHVLRIENLRALPNEIPEARATLAANLETAVTCVWDAEVGLGDRALVLGGGVVGILTAWLLVRAGAKVSLVEPRRQRRDAALALVPELALGDTGEGSADVVVEASGDPRALDVAVEACASGGRIVVASFYGNRRTPLDLGDRFHRERLELRSSQVSRIPPRLSARWDGTRRFSLVVELLAEPGLDHLLAPPVPFARAPQLYASLDGNSDVPPAHVFVYR